MKRIKFIASIAALFILLTALFTVAQEHAGHNMEMKDADSSKKSEIDLIAVDKNADGMVFECPMDWEVLSDEAGRCPKCEMKFKEYSLADAKRNLEKHGHRVKENEMTGDHEMGKGEHHEMKGASVNVAAIDENKDGKVFQCPMCANQLSDEAGRCPTCDMELKETSVNDAKENTHKHSHGDKSHDNEKMKSSAAKKCEYGCCS